MVQTFMYLASLLLLSIVVSLTCTFGLKIGQCAVTLIMYKLFKVESLLWFVSRILRYRSCPQETQYASISASVKAALLPNVQECDATEDQ